MQQRCFEPTYTRFTEANQYRAYIIDPDGHIQKRFDLFCEDDDAAKERAAALIINGHDIELWQLDRKVATFTRKK